MIMKEHIGLRLSRFGLVAIGLLAIAALPAWSQSPEPGAGGGTAVPAAEAVSETLGIDAAGDVIYSYRTTGLGGRYTTTSLVESEGFSREAALRQELIATLEKLKQQAVAAGRQQEATAIDARITALEAENVVYLTSYRGRVGQTVRLKVVGKTNGYIWGGADGVYTDDSDLGTAAVHAGAVKPGERATVAVEILGGRDSYGSSTQNGVRSHPYGAWQGSYRIAAPVATKTAPAYRGPRVPGRRQPAGTGSAVTLPGSRGQADKGKLVLVLVDVVGTTSGSVWGDGVYTDDSSVGAAAVHAGLIKSGQRATVVVQILPGRDSYQGSTRNGVTSRSYASWDGSFQLLGCVQTQGTIELRPSRLTDVERVGIDFSDSGAPRYHGYQPPPMPTN